MDLEVERLMPAEPVICSSLGKSVSDMLRFVSEQFSYAFNMNAAGPDVSALVAGGAWGFAADRAAFHRGAVRPAGRVSRAQGQRVDLHRPTLKQLGWFRGDDCNSDRHFHRRAMGVCQRGGTIRTGYTDSSAFARVQVSLP